MSHCPCALVDEASRIVKCELCGNNMCSACIGLDDSCFTCQQVYCDDCHTTTECGNCSYAPCRNCAKDLSQCETCDSITCEGCISREFSYDKAGHGSKCPVCQKYFCVRCENLYECDTCNVTSCTSCHDHYNLGPCKAKVHRERAASLRGPE
jgi:hypothetical protein